MPDRNKIITVDEVKKLQLDILNEVDIFCNKNNISYFLSYGTLLGAVRHHGYIPWDDDIDIMMLRSDYDIFVHSFTSAKNRYKVIAPEVEASFPYAFAKVIDNNTILIEKTGIQYPIGVNIDLFPFDDFPDKRAVESIVKKLKITNKILQIKRIWVKDRGIIKNIVLRILKICTALCPTEWCIRRIVHLGSTYKNQNKKYVAAISEYVREHVLLEKRWLNQKTLVEFEGLVLPAPIFYDEVLSAWYGDYMKLPPVEKRVTHHNYTAFWK